MGLGDIEAGEVWRFDQNTDEQILACMDEYLPEGWKKNRVHRRQVYLVVEKYLKSPGGLTIEEREMRARKSIAELETVDPKTIEDATGRRLYSRKYRAKFRRDLSNIERCYSDS